MPPRKYAVSSPIDILLVEDNAGDVRLMREALKEAEVSAKLHVVPDGEQALSYLRRQEPHDASPSPQLVLLDLNLPRTDGREVLSEMKRDRNLRKIPVVVLSNSNRLEDARHAGELQALRYVTKPSDLRGLIELGRALDSFSRGGDDLEARPKPPATAVKPRAQSASQRSA